MGWSNKKKLGLAGLAALTVLGTVGGSDGGAGPFYNKKTGDSYGICIGGVTRFEEGSRHYGINIALLGTGVKKGAEIYGLNVNFLSINQGGIINGVDLAGASSHDPKSLNPKDIGTINGAQITLGNIPEGGTREKDGWYAPVKVNGLQASVFGNSATAGKVVQIGFYNHNEIQGQKDSGRNFFLVNWRFK